MSSLQRRLSPWIAQALTSRRLRDLRRTGAELRRRLRGEPHTIRYFHDLQDPYSHLAAQLLAPLTLRYDIIVEPHLAGPPPDEAAPERERLVHYSRLDAADIAPGYGLDFPMHAKAPSAADVELAGRLLSGALDEGVFQELAVGVGDALWRGDRRELEQLASSRPTPSREAFEARQEAGSRLRHSLGHYLGATFSYGGEWYWGVDRLQHLEHRLQKVGGLRTAGNPEPIAPRPDPSREPAPQSDRPVALEIFASLRSPYTAIALGRIEQLANRLPIELVLRPVLPMVMRGLPVPRAKQLYIVLDTKREADDAGESFGCMCDPVGRPVERGFSLYPFARDRSRGLAFLRAFTQCAFAEGVDTGTDAGLRKVVEAAGLSWSEALPFLDQEGWRDELEVNRKLLFESGLWGVPSFRVRSEGEADYATWGQDRLWRVEQEIRRRLG
ncbi:MAG: 2-hydroxychromene-2-carboxylate isomerase [bacterium]|nr:2-hydroxychromene-2-carboxylate isomerase [bacterium]